MGLTCAEEHKIRTDYGGCVDHEGLKKILAKTGVHWYEISIYFYRVFVDLSDR